MLTGYFYARSMSFMVRRGISFNADDEKVIESLKQRLSLTQGQISRTGVIRLALRKLYGELEANPAATPEHH